MDMKTIGQTRGAPFCTLMPKPRNPAVAKGVAISIRVRRNSGSKTPLFLLAMNLAAASAIHPESGEPIRPTTRSGKFVKPICAGPRLYGGAEKAVTESTEMVSSPRVKVQSVCLSVEFVPGAQLTREVGSVDNCREQHRRIGDERNWLPSALPERLVGEATAEKSESLNVCFSLISVDRPRSALLFKLNRGTSRPIPRSFDNDEIHEH